MTPAPHIPDLTDHILAAAAPAAPSGPGGLRGALALVGVLQLGLGAAQLLGADFGMTAAHGEHATTFSAHLLNESTAWTFALGAGFLVAARRPATVAGSLPVVAVFVAVLTCYVAADWVADRMTAARLASHGVVLAGLMLLALLGRRAPDADHHTPIAAEPTRVPGLDRRGRRRRLRDGDSLPGSAA